MGGKNGGSRAALAFAGAAATGRGGAAATAERCPVEDDDLVTGAKDSEVSDSDSTDLCFCGAAECSELENRVRVGMRKLCVARRTAAMKKNNRICAKSPIEHPEALLAWVATCWFKAAAKERNAGGG